MKKRIISCVTTLAVLFSMITPALATENPKRILYDCASSSVITEISDVDAFAAMFTSDSIELKTSVAEAVTPSAVYNYSVSYDSNTNIYSVKMDINLLVNDITYSCKAVGDLSAISVDGSTLLTGPLNGTVEGLDSCELTVGYNQWLENDSLSCYITLKKDNQFVVAHFGQNIFTDTLIQDLAATSNWDDTLSANNSISSVADTTRAVSSNYTKCGSVTATMSSTAVLAGATGKAHTCTAYFKPAISKSDAENMMIISVNSYCSSLAAQFPYSYSTGVYQINTLLPLHIVN